MVISAAMNGCWSPTTRHWLINQCARTRSSSTAGATFLPPAATEEQTKPGAERRPAAYRRDALAAQRGPQLPVHELVEDGVLQPEDDRHGALLAGLRVGDRHALGKVEDLALAVRVRLLLRRV